MTTRGFKEHMAILQERMFFTPPKPEDRLKPWTTADIAKFAAANPTVAADMHTLRSAGMVSAVGGLAGGFGGAAFFFSRPGTFNGKMFTAVLGSHPSLPAHMRGTVARVYASVPLFVFLFRLRPFGAPCD